MIERNYVQKNKGITLISLTITITLLIILVGISLGIVLKGDSLSKARRTSNTTIGKINEQDESISKENSEWDEMEIDLCSHIWVEGKIIVEPTCTTSGKKEKECENCGKTVEVEAPALGHNYENRLCTRCGDIIPIQPGDRAVENEEYNGATIPKGFTISKIPGETTVDEGLVIYDIPAGTTVNWTDKDSVKTAYNQFVWIPVEVTSSDTETNISAFTRSAWTANTATGGERTTELDSEYTEPYSNTTDDYDASTGIKTQIANLTKSIYKYGGFYIGRYEAGVKPNADGTSTRRKSSSSQTAECVIQQDKYPYNWITWGKSMSDISEGAVYLSNSLYNTNEYGATSMLCTGACWDSMLDFIKDSNHSVTDSTTWGNYKNSETYKIYRGGLYSKIDSTWSWDLADKANGTDVTKNENVLLTTGATERNCSKNIYDVAGNCYEWTTESYSSSIRVGRGRRFHLRWF